MDLNWLKSLDNSNWNELIKIYPVSKFLRLRMRERVYKILSSILIYILMSPQSLAYNEELIGKPHYYFQLELIDKGYLVLK